MNRIKSLQFVSKSLLFFIVWFLRNCIESNQGQFDSAHKGCAQKSNRLQGLISFSDIRK